MIVRSCIIIELVIYGPTPSITIERRESPPPENIFKMPKKSLLERNWLRATGSTPGIGMLESSINTINENSTNRTLFRKVISTHTNFILLKKVCISLSHFYFLSLYAQALANFVKFLSFLWLFVRRKNKNFLDRFKLISAILRQSFNDITKLWTALVAGAGCLTLASATCCLATLASAAHQPVSFILMSSF